MLSFWLAWSYFFRKKRILNILMSFSFLGLVIGVSCLVIAMSVVSGFDTTLRKAIIDVSGDIVLVKKVKNDDSWKELSKKVKKIENNIVSSCPFIYLEGILTFKNNINGSIVQAIDQECLSGEVLRLQKRIIKGKLFLDKNEDGIYPAFLGKDIVKKMKLNLGDYFNFVLPIQNKFNPSIFSRKIGKFKLAGILNFGKYEYDSKYFITNIKAAQDLFDISNKYTGLILKVNDSYNARSISYSLREKLGYDFWTRDWQEVNENIFSAIKYEKLVIFIVILLMVIAAAFNISSSLYIDVVKKYEDISILKTIGLPNVYILFIFSFYGLLIGLVGVFFGTFLGISLGKILMYIQSTFNIIPADVYKLDFIFIELRWTDISLIALISLVICFISSLAPAIKGALLNPTEGLRYE